MLEPRAGDSSAISDQDGTDLDLPESNTLSFIVKVWLEDRSNPHHAATWRGHITHVPSGARRYIKSLGEIIDFIVPYLEALRAQVEIYWRVRRSMKHGIGELSRRLARLERRR